MKSACKCISMVTGNCVLFLFFTCMLLVVDFNIQVYKAIVTKQENIFKASLQLVGFEILHRDKNMIKVLLKVFL